MTAEELRVLSDRLAEAQRDLRNLMDEIDLRCSLREDFVDALDELRSVESALDNHRLDLLRREARAL